MSADSVTPGDLLKRAAAYLERGNLGAADAHCRLALFLAPENPSALNMMGVMATLIERYDYALRFFARALACEPQFAAARANLERVTSASNTIAQGAADANAGKRYLLIKACGFGFWGDVNHVLGALLLAEVTGRIPVTHWGDNSLFTDGSGRDAFPFYFEPVSRLAVDDLLALNNPAIFPAKWTLQNLRREKLAVWQGEGSRTAAIYYLNRTETVAVSDFYIGVIDVMPWLAPGHPLYGKSVDDAYRYLLARYLRPRGYLLSEIEAFFGQRLAGTHVIAAHLRGSDKRAEMQDLAEINRRYFDIIDRVEPAWRIFLLTDDSRLVDGFREKYGARVVLTDSERTGRDVGLHYSYTGDRVQLGTEVLVDTYLAARAEKFVGNGGSNVSAMIALLKEWPPNDCVLLSPSVLHEPNILIHTRQLTG